MPKKCLTMVLMVLLIGWENVCFAVNDLTISGDLTVTGSSSVTGSLEVDGASTLSGSLTVNGSASFSGINNSPIGATTPSTGNFTTLNATNSLALNGVPITTSKLGKPETSQSTTYYSTSSTSYTTITELDVTITPTASNHSMLVMFAPQIFVSTAGRCSFKILRNAVNIYEYITAHGYYSGATGGGSVPFITVIDSPATTSAVTYHLAYAALDGTGNCQMVSTAPSTGLVMEMFP